MENQKINLQRREAETQLQGRGWGGRGRVEHVTLPSEIPSASGAGGRISVKGRFGFSRSEADPVIYTSHRLLGDDCAGPWSEAWRQQGVVNVSHITVQSHLSS